jgi:hypothetical protein
VKPAYTFFNSDITRKKMSTLLYLHPCLFRSHACNVKISSLTETMGGKIHRRLSSDKTAPIASQPTLRLSFSVTQHRTLKNIATDNQQAMQEIRVKELPGRLPPLGKRMGAYELIDIEVRADRV